MQITLNDITENWVIILKLSLVKAYTALDLYVKAKQLILSNTLFFLEV